MVKASDSLVLPKQAIRHVLGTASNVAVESKQRAETLVTQAEAYCGLSLPFPTQYVAMASVSCIAITTTLASKIGEIGVPRKEVLINNEQIDRQVEVPETKMEPEDGNLSAIVQNVAETAPQEALKGIDGGKITANQPPLDRLMAELDSSMRERQTLELRVHELEELLSSTNQDFKSNEVDWKSKHDSLTNELNVVRGERLDIARQHDEGLRIVETMETDLSQLRSTTMEQNNVLDDLNTRILARDDEIANLRLRLTAEQKSFQDKHLALQDEVQAQISHAESLTTAIHTAEETRNAERQELDKVRKESEMSYQSKIDEHVQSIEQIQVDHSSEMQSAKSLHEAEMADLVESHEAELDYLKSTIDTIRSQLSESSKLADSKAKEVSDLEDEHQRGLSDLQSKHQLTETTYKESISTLEADRAKHEEMIQAQRSKIQTLENDLRLASDTAEGLRNEKIASEQKSSSEISQLKEELISLQVTMESLKTHNTQLETSTRELENVRVANQQLEDSVTARTIAADEINRDHEELKSVLQNKTIQLDKLRQDHENLQARLIGSTTDYAHEREASEANHRQSVVEKDQAMAEITRLQKLVDAHAAQQAERYESEVSLLKIVNRNSQGDLMTSRNSQGELTASIVSGREPLSHNTGGNQSVSNQLPDGASKFSEHLGTRDDDLARDYEEEARVREYTERMLIGASNSRRQPYIPSTTNTISYEEDRRVSGGSTTIVSPKTPSTTAFDHASTVGIMTPSSPRQAPPIPATNGSSGSRNSGSTTPTRRQSGFKRLFRRASAKFNNSNSASASPPSMTEIMNNGVLHK